MTKEHHHTQESYVAAEGRECPHCGSMEIEDAPEVEVVSAGLVTIKVKCRCGFKWWEAYKLVSWKELGE